MARKLTKHDFPNPGRPHRYNWAEWSDGSPWELKKGVDYTNPNGLIASARAYAWREGLRCSVDRSSESVIVLQFFTT